MGNDSGKNIRIQPPEKNNPTYHTCAEMAARLGVSSSTIARYQAEFAAQLGFFAPPGGGRGLRTDAVEVLKLIQEMKARRASWIDIKQAIEEKFGQLQPGDEILSLKSFRHSLEAIRQAQVVMTNELHLLLREIDRRLNRLEKAVKIHKLAKIEPQPRKGKGKPVQPEVLFPDEDKTGEFSE